MIFKSPEKDTISMIIKIRQTIPNTNNGTPRINQNLILMLHKINTMKINDLIRKRYSTLAFSQKEVEEEKINLLIEAASWAPSARNEQPWRFIIGGKEKGSRYQRIFSSLMKSNQQWVKNAPLLIVCLAKLNYQHKNRSNKYAIHDLGMATANLSIQATELDLFVHPMGGFEKDILISEFNIPEGFQVVTVLAIGYGGSIEKIPEELQIREKMPRTRKSFAELVYSGDFSVL